MLRILQTLSKEVCLQFRNFRLEQSCWLKLAAKSKEFLNPIEIILTERAFCDIPSTSFFY